MRRPSQTSSSTIECHPVPDCRSDTDTMRGAPAMISPVGSPHAAERATCWVYFAAAVQPPLVIGRTPPDSPAPLHGKCTGRRNRYATAQALLLHMSRSPSGELETYFSLPCCQLFATMARAMEWQ